MCRPSLFTAIMKLSAEDQSRSDVSNNMQTSLFVRSLRKSRKVPDSSCSQSNVRLLTVGSGGVFRRLCGSRACRCHQFKLSSGSFLCKPQLGSVFIVRRALVGDDNTFLLLARSADAARRSREEKKNKKHPQ